MEFAQLIEEFGAPKLLIQKRRFVDADGVKSVNGNTNDLTFFGLLF